MQCHFLGALAQLARVLDWQSKGRGFDSHTLHKITLQYIEKDAYCVFFYDPFFIIFALHFLNQILLHDHFFKKKETC